MSTEGNHREIPLTASGLRPVLSQRFALTWEQAAVCSTFVALFMYLNYIPLFHTEIWRHVGIGEWIIQNRKIPQFNPLLELSVGMDYVCTSWLSQVCLLYTSDAADE